MEGGFDLIKFIHPEAIPYAVLLVAGALLLNRIVASSLDAAARLEPTTSS